jgi:hypothetical protein
VGCSAVGGIPPAPQTEEEDQNPPYNRIIKEAGREEDQINSWIKSVIKEAGISWNELSFLATDKKWKEFANNIHS